MASTMIEKMTKPTFDDYLPVDNEHTALLVIRKENGKESIETKTLIPGHIYMLEVKSFESESMCIHGYIDDRIVNNYIKKFYAERKTPLVAFTNRGGIEEIASGLHVIEAAHQLGIKYVNGAYVPRSAFNSKEVKVLA